jgi:SAM-dependent methyltransferase
MSDTYKHWDTKFIQDKYKDLKYWKGIFSSEEYFWEKVGRPGMKVLDIGCASGNLFHALKERFGQVEYVGIDGSASLIDRAKELTSEAKFVTKDIFALDQVEFKEKFDVVVATGVWQHEPKYKELLDIMLSYAKDGGHILFDVKLFHEHKTLDDINIAYGDHGDHKVYYIIFNYQDFINLIKNKLDVLQNIEFYGYDTEVNFSVRLPDTVTEKVCSSHVLLQKKSQASDTLACNINLPDKFDKKLI